jgi:hypothetical protein
MAKAKKSEKVLVEYKHGNATTSRQLDLGVLEELGLEADKSLVWSPENDHTVEVSEKDSEILFEQFPDEFGPVHSGPEVVDSEPTETVEKVVE